MRKKNPIAFLFEHREKILEIVMDNFFNLEDAWRQIKAELPKIREVMDFIEFENYIVYVPLVDKEVRKFKDEKKSLEFEVQKLMEDLKSKNFEVQKLKEDLKSKIQQLTLANSKISELYYENESLKDELKEKLQQGWVMAGVKVGTGLSDVPKNFEGWTVQFRDPYIRLYKKIGGALQSVHLGKYWDETKARAKIKKKLEEIESS